MTDEFVGHIQDIPSRAVILVQHDINDIIEVIIEFHDDALVGATPGIDGLIRITNDINRSRWGNKQPHQSILHIIRVLVFIHEDMGEFPLPTFFDFWNLLQNGDANQDQIIEIEGKHRPFLAFIGLIEIKQFLLIIKDIVTDGDVFWVFAFGLLNPNIMNGLFD